MPPNKSLEKYKKYKKSFEKNCTKQNNLYYYIFNFIMKYI